MADVTQVRALYDCFRQEFARLPLTVKAVADGDTARAEVVAGHVGLMVTLLGALRRGEEVVWTALAEGDPDAVAVVGRLREQVMAIEPTARTADEQARVWAASGSPTDRAAVHTTLIALEKQLLSQLALAEQEALPLVARDLSQDQLDAAAQASLGGLADDDALVAVGLVLAAASADAAPVVAAALPPAVRAAYDERGEQAFAAYRARLTDY